MSADNILGYTDINAALFPVCQQITYLVYTDINVTLFGVCQQLTHLVILISMLHYSVYVSR